MEKWRQAALKLIDRCDFQQDIVCAFITGSYATGNADEFSDIDLFLVLNDHITWRERGSRLIDGYLVEYFANPLRIVRQEIASAYDSRSATTINMVQTSILLLNKKRTYETLKADCARQMARGQRPLSSQEKLMKAYYIWNEYDELKRSYHKQQPDFAVLCHHFGVNLIEAYAQFIGSPLPPRQHLYRWLSDAVYRDNYGFPAFADAVFQPIMLAFFEEKGRAAMLQTAEKMYQYVCGTLDDFDINHFSLRSSC